MLASFGRLGMLFDCATGTEELRAEEAAAGAPMAAASRDGRRSENATSGRGARATLVRLESVAP